MPVGARTPEELETLLEDAFVLHDPQALAQLFQPGATLVVGGGLPKARGRRQIARVAAQLWDSQRLYLADPRRVLQARDTALVVSKGGREARDRAAPSAEQPQEEGEEKDRRPVGGQEPAAHVPQRHACVVRRPGGRMDVGMMLAHGEPHKRIGRGRTASRRQTVRCGLAKDLNISAT